MLNTTPIEELTSMPRWVFRVQRPLQWLNITLILEYLELCWQHTFLSLLLICDRTDFDFDHGDLCNCCCASERCFWALAHPDVIELSLFLESKKRPHRLLNGYVGVYSCWLEQINLFGASEVLEAVIHASPEIFWTVSSTLFYWNICIRYLLTSCRGRVFLALYRPMTFINIISGKRITYAVPSQTGKLYQRTQDTSQRSEQRDPSWLFRWEGYRRIRL